jgi:class III poly(R)-hydroxyalkanoic acid synthase PhaE subunit
MDGEFWRQWQAFAAMFVPGAAATQSPFAPSGASSATDYAAAAERFYADARRLLASGAQPGSAAGFEAMRAFSDALRERFAAFFPALGGAAFGAAQQGMPGWLGADMPALGPNREHQQRWQRIIAAWGRMSEAQNRLQRLCTDALREAAESFAQRALASAAPAADPGALHALYDQWIDSAEQAYARAAHGEAFSSALADYMNAASAWRADLREGVEQWSQWLDLPTRSELNTLLQRLKVLEERSQPVAPVSRKRRPSAARSKSAPARGKSARRRRGRRKP